MRHVLPNGMALADAAWSASQHEMKPLPASTAVSISATQARMASIIGSVPFDIPICVSSNVFGRELGARTVDQDGPRWPMLLASILRYVLWHSHDLPMPISPIWGDALRLWNKRRLQLSSACLWEWTLARVLTLTAMLAVIFTAPSTMDFSISSPHEALSRPTNVIEIHRLRMTNIGFLFRSTSSRQ